MCMTPWSAKTLSKDYQDVPCGKCPECIKRNISQWSFRLLQEEKHSDTAYFITLTYDNDHIPIQRSGYLTLRPRDLQLFFKKLRKAHTKQRHNRGVPNIRYFAVGEYGGRTLRPHYHLVLFNSSLEIMFGKQDLLALHYTGYDGACPVKLIQWEHGNATVGHVTGASVGYVLKYMSKPGKIPMHRNDDRVPEFRRMSKGIGEKYLTPAQKQWHVNDLKERMYCSLDGKKLSMPRYYKERIYDEYQRSIVGDYQRQKLIEEKSKIITENPNYEWDTVQKKHQEFHKMYKQAVLNRDKI